MAAGAQLDHPCSSQPGLLLKLNRYLLAVIPRFVPKNNCLNVYYSDF